MGCFEGKETSENEKLLQYAEHQLSSGVNISNLTQVMTAFPESLNSQEYSQAKSMLHIHESHLSPDKQTQFNAFFRGNDEENQFDRRKLCLLGLLLCSGSRSEKITVLFKCGELDDGQKLIAGSLKAMLKDVFALALEVIPATLTRETNSRFPYAAPRVYLQRLQAQAPLACRRCTSNLGKKRSAVRLDSFIQSFEEIDVDLSPAGVRAYTLSQCSGYWSDTRSQVSDDDLHPKLSPVTLVLIENSLIEDVIEVNEDRLVSDLMSEYAAWNPVDLEDYYLSPGLIDFNIRRNSVWESLESMTEAAISGGVTLCLEEKIVTESDVDETGARYCDTGVIAVLNNSEVSARDVQNAVAVKGYLTPPDHCTDPIIRLPHWLEAVSGLNLPIILDPTVASAKGLYHASPCRIFPPEERLKTAEGPGASLESGDSESEDPGEELASIQNWQTKFREATRKRYKRPEFRIHSAIEERVPATVGTDHSSFEITSYSSDISLELHRDQGCMKGRRRPPPLAVATPQSSLESLYIKQLIRYPENWELQGVKKILLSLGGLNIKVHISNLSSGKAVAEIEKSKDKRITCETCPQFLFFTDHQIPDGDTRFKSYPPIRNNTNCNFLWDLMKRNAIDCVCSQHRAIPAEYKCKPNFSKALAGVCGLGFTLQALWTLLKSPYMEKSSCEHFLVSIAKWTALNPATILGLPRRGEIKKGCVADIVVWDPFEEVTISRSRAGQPLQCPYLEQKLFGKIQQVYVRGELAFDQGEARPVGMAVSQQDWSRLD